MKAFDRVGIEELSQVADAIAEICKNYPVIIFDGEMGAGKTTLISKVCQILKVEDEPSSPTFSIVNTYLSSEVGNLHHFDFYRIEDEEEAMASGLDEIIDSGDVCFIEWAEKIPNLLPENYVRVAIEVVDPNHRKITIEK